eukprot:gnl/TRDRNA2_/TRDRNA2_165588_c0_seq5.p1 gnl/TRDRNA2_/TRDRNA2_165588_c0~~gnl/TRDRNA2_/TRDRNA2_165588_c0_seq5.p1  ORF type:complete len:155 (-),score=16.73 gnl/TRDRNA2_/TRDRNA2_165588_c0_seq5:32-439(-)
MSYENNQPGGSTAVYIRDGQAGSNVAQYLKMAKHLFLVKSLTWNEVLRTYAKDTHEFFLKLDCEGCEYEIGHELFASRDRIMEMRGEMHPKDRWTNTTVGYPEMFALFSEKKSGYDCAGKWCEKWPEWIYGKVGR